MCQEMFMVKKRKYKYEVIGTECSNEGIFEGVSSEFNTLSSAKEHVEKFSNNKLGIVTKQYISSNLIFKFYIIDGYTKYVKRVWVYNDKKWYSTRKMRKYQKFIEY